MIWVIDGTRLKYDFKRFTKNIENLRPFIMPFSLYTVNRVEEILPNSWLSATVPLYFDFRPEKIDDSESDQQKSLRNLMWGFFRIGKTIFAVSMPHNCFVDYIQKEVIRNIEQYVITTLQKMQIIHMLQQKSQLQNIRQNYRSSNIRRRRRL